MAITQKQAATMAVILLVGLTVGGGVLLTARHQADTGPADEAGQPHGDGKEHPDKETTHGAHEEHEERRVELTDQQLRQAGIQLQAAGPAKLQSATEFSGEIRFDEDRMAHVVPRVAGVAEQVAARLGQTVRRGEVLAVLASTSLSEQRSELLTAEQRRDAAHDTFQREKTLWQERISAEQDYLQARAALQEADIAVRNARQKLAAVGATAASTHLNRFEVRAPFDGTIVEKHLALGEAVKEDASIFTIADLRTVWAEFQATPRDLAAVRTGQRAIVSSTAFEGQVEGSVAYVGALLGEQTRSARVRVTLAHPQGAWRPGLFVTVSVLGDAADVALAVDAQAVQSIDNQSVVFKAEAGGFEASPVKLGRSDGRQVEVLGGLKAGDQVAARNSYLLKSELGKASAEHGH